jgi:hypothetical protein
MEHTVLQHQTFWIGTLVALVIGVLIGISLHRSYVTRTRVKLARQHLDHLFATGQVQAVKYVPVRRWFGGGSRILAANDSGEFEVPEKPTYSKEHSPVEYFAGFSASETCAAADNLRADPAYMATEWTPSNARGQRAWTIRRKQSRAA